MIVSFTYPLQWRHITLALIVVIVSSWLYITTCTSSSHTFGSEQSKGSKRAIRIPLTFIWAQSRQLQSRRTTSPAPSIIDYPSIVPSILPTIITTDSPSNIPTELSTRIHLQPSDVPSSTPSSEPSNKPSIIIDSPSIVPSRIPTIEPTITKFTQVAIPKIGVNVTVPTRQIHATVLNEWMETFLTKFFEGSSPYRKSFASLSLSTKIVQPKTKNNNNKRTTNRTTKTTSDDRRTGQRRISMTNTTKLYEQSFVVEGYAYFDRQTTKSKTNTKPPTNEELNDILTAYFSFWGDDNLIQYYQDNGWDVQSIAISINGIPIQQSDNSSTSTVNTNNNNNDDTNSNSTYYIIIGAVVGAVVIAVVVTLFVILIRRRAATKSSEDDNNNYNDRNVQIGNNNRNNNDQIISVIDDDDVLTIPPDVPSTTVTTDNRTKMLSDTANITPTPTKTASSPLSPQARYFLGGSVRNPPNHNFSTLSSSSQFGNRNSSGALVLSQSSSSLKSPRRQNYSVAANAAVSNENDNNTNIIATPAIAILRPQPPTTTAEIQNNTNDGNDDLESDILSIVGDGSVIFLKK